MTITPLTRTDGSAGRRKEDARPIINLLKQLAAGEWNNIADAVIELQTEFNALTGGTTIVDEDFAGAFRGTLTRTGVGAYAARRDEINADPPDAGDDVADGFLPGSIWVQIAGYPGPYDNPPAHTLWVCKNNNAGEAEWVEVFDRQKVRVSGVVASDQAITKGTDIWQVDTTVGGVTLMLPDPAETANFAVKKINTGANGISLQPHDTSGTGPSIEGQAAGSTIDLPDSDTAARGYWYFYSDGANWWFAQ